VIPGEPAAKVALRTELLEAIQADLDTMERAHRAAREGATHEEAKPENDKDTRALEQSYLARGQAKRLEELRACAVEVSAMTLRDFAGEGAALGALVTVDDGAQETTLFLAPAGGGARLADGAVQVVTPQSPLGRALFGKRAGDEVDVVVAGKARSKTVVRVV
jgi:transcription elongation GreA/GreB family factor